MTAASLIFFYSCAAVAIVGALATVIAKNPIRGAMGLMCTILAVAGIFLALHAHFLAAIQLIVYAGAIVVLFIFVIMLIGPAATAPKDSRGIVARIIGATASGFVGLQILLVLARKVIPRVPVAQASFGTIESIGDKLFTEYLVPFEVSSFLLMVAIVGAVAVARGKQPDPTKEAEGALTPGGEPAAALAAKPKMAKSSVTEAGA